MPVEKVCRGVGCENDTSDAPDRGAYAGLCGECRKIKAKAVHHRSRTRVRRPDDPDLVTLTKKLVPAARKLTTSVHARREAQQRQTIALLEFKEIIIACRDAANALLNARADCEVLGDDSRS